MAFYKDTYGIRYQHVSVCSSVKKSCIFLPGGPGVDSSYFNNLSSLLRLPTHVWFLDFPGNGSNEPHDFEDFDHWFKLFPIMMSRFEKPILIGHSFGAMFPLLYPELEHLLSGLILLNGIPSLPKRSSSSVSTAEEKRFLQNPSEETFRKALESSMHFHFTEPYEEEGRLFLRKLPFNWKAPLWWKKTCRDIDYTAQWIPHKVPVLILGNEDDIIAPFSMFQEDPRFQRDNITIKSIKNSRHHCWMDNPQDTVEAIHQFLISIFHQDE